MSVHYKNDTVKRMMEESGECQSLAFPGSYTLIYVDSQSSVYCAECATKQAEDIATVMTYDEGPTLECEGCGEHLESSYGDPEDKE